MSPLSLKLKSDIPAGVVVFLVALPLCLGVALASGAPLFSGIISGIVGGIIVGTISGSHTSVSGPAAGLTAVVLASIAALGSFELFLTSVVLAGFIQIILGVVKAGTSANFIPSNVISGLLAAIGIILILKQIPHALGYDADAEEDFSFFQLDGENTFSELVKMFGYITPGALVISILSIAILVLWDKTPVAKFRYLPSSLFVVALGIGLSYCFSKYFPLLALDRVHLVNIPLFDFGNVRSYIHLPDLSLIFNFKVITVALTIAAVASLETLINLEAIDKLDPHKRHSPPNRELVAQGIGNITAGFLGGIPVTSVVVRSTINIQAENQSKYSAIINGLLMLLSVLFLAEFLSHIPLSSIAAILIVAGYKLTPLRLFRQVYKKGLNQFIPFITTIVAILFSDLLSGVLIGLVISIFFLMLSKYRNPFKVDKLKLHIGEVLKVELASQVSFFNKSSIREALWQVPEGMKVIIDASRCDFVDHDVLEVIEDFKQTVAPERKIRLNVIGLKEKYEVRDQIQFINVLDKKTQSSLTPAEVLDLLKEGNKRFVSGKRAEKYYRHQVNATSNQQNPMAVVISCMDSRAAPEVVFDAGIGDLLVIRIAGNIIDTAIVASLELAVSKMGVRLIFVMSHSNCGAVGAAIHGLHEGNLQAVTSRIDRAINRYGYRQTGVTTVDDNMIRDITWQNAENSVSDITALSDDLRRAVARGDLKLATGYYDTSTGKVTFGVGS